MPAPSSIPLGRKLCFAVIPLIVLLLLGETIARLTLPRDLKSNRFFYVAGGHEEYFGTRKLSIPYTVHPPYHWVPAPNTPITNNKGFRGRDWHEAKPEGLIRIASLGDSCTLGGQESYSERLDRLLAEALGPGRYEVLNGGVGSSSTHQMLQIFEQYVLPMKPDIAVVFLGWNDRWVHDGRSDSAHQLPTPFQARMRDALAVSRLFQGLVYFADRSRSSRIEQRVPPAETARNLRRFARLCRDRGIALHLATTPDGMPEDNIRRRFDPAKRQRDWDSDLYDLVQARFDGPVAAWRGLNEEYNGVVRTTAREEKVSLIDLAADIEPLRALYPEPPLYFFKDGIHLTELGLQELALLLAQGVLPPEDRARVLAYAGSAAYFFTNAYTFARQFQYPAAEDYLQKARALGPLPDGEEALDAEIKRERPFYERYENARIARSLGAPPASVFADYFACHQLRPEDADLRIDTAILAKDAGRCDLALQLTLGFNQYDGPQWHQALWVAAECAGRSGERDLLVQILRRLEQLFPNDPRARQTLNAIGGG
ncbi:MAG TPA: SGNH/GDSL hydrolase family protein [Kiritimatiellia bacterium]|nr:SGNH/GDSL hydrolase family protein [Kiritimatiellia bacterium]